MEEINKLVKVLKKQLYLYEVLSKLCKREEKAIIEGDLKKLEEVVEEEEKIFTQMKIWEKLRMNIVKIMKDKLSLPQNVTFSSLIVEMKEKNLPYFHVESLRKKIISKIAEINRINRRNISLLEYSIKIINEYFHRLTGTKSTPTYNLKGKAHIQEQTRKLLNKIS
ncbi:flagellar export chaperone FlgN [Candidatus Aerophobetes bacterium]|nr:flagellar export chaperone FlgN [Candidatus Aerophobetes bacterium]